MIPPPRGSDVPVAAFEAGLSAFSASSGSELDDEAQPAFVPASDSFDPVGGIPGDEDGPPIEALEAQMRGELAAREEAAATPAARRAAAREEDDDEAAGGGKAQPLPEIDELVSRLPAEVRETLDELFRARFVSVKKLPKKLFGTAAGKAARPDPAP